MDQRFQHHAGSEDSDIQKVILKDIWIDTSGIMMESSIHMSFSMSIHLIFCVLMDVSSMMLEVLIHLFFTMLIDTSSMMLETRMSTVDNVDPPALLEDSTYPSKLRSVLSNFLFGDCIS